MSRGYAADRGTGRAAILHTTHETSELVRQAERLMRLAVGAGAKQGVPGLPDAKREQFLGLLTLKSAQIFDGVGGQGDDTVPTVLRRLEPNPCFRLLEALHHAQRSALKINVFPTHR